MTNMTIRTRIALGVSAAALSRGFLLLLAGERCRGFGQGLRLPAFLLRLGRLARLLGLGARSRNRRTLGKTRGNRGIIGPGLGTEFVQKILLRLLCRLLPVREVRFLESTH